MMMIKYLSYSKIKTEDIENRGVSLCFQSKCGRVEVQKGPNDEVELSVILLQRWVIL